MTEKKGHQGWTNYPTCCVHLWITKDEETHKYWTDLTYTLQQTKTHPAPHLRDALRARISDSMPQLPPMWHDLLTNTLDEEVNWQEIADALLEH